MMQEEKVSKKGLSHVEMILSFVIFLGFLLFVFSLFNPLEQDTKENPELKLLKRKILDNVSEEVNFQTIKLNKTISCFEFEYNISEKVIIKNKDEQIINSNSSGNKVAIGNNSSDFFYILSSKEFNERKVQDCSNYKYLPKSNYTLGLWRNYHMISNKSLYDLKRNYEQDYEDLKKSFNLNSNFLFAVKDPEGNVLLNVIRRKPETNIYARDIPIQIIYESGEIKYNILNIQIW